MKVRNSRLYPYPIYSSSTQDYIDNKFEVERQLQYTSETATIQCKINIPNGEILDLITNNKIGLYCHVECSVTKYRQLFEIKVNESMKYNIDIPLSELNEEIETICLLVTKQSIEHFSNKSFSLVYSNRDIKLDKYYTIGFTDEVKFIINKKIDINGSIPSIFLITLDETAKQMKYNAYADQIQIFLPKTEYDIYEKLKGSHVRLKQVMINFPVLVNVIEDIKNDIDGDRELEKYGWYSVISNSLKKQNINGYDDDKFKNGISFDIAQNILNNVEYDSIKELDDLHKKSKGDD